MKSPQMASLMRRYHVTNQRALLRAIAAEYSEETGERFTQFDASLMLDGMLEAEYQRLASTDPVEVGISQRIERSACER